MEIWERFTEARLRQELEICGNIIALCLARALQKEYLLKDIA